MTREPSPWHIYDTIEPGVSVYDKNTCYFSENTEEFLEEHNFKIVSWECDEPIENTFK